MQPGRRRLVQRKQRALVQEPLRWRHRHAGTSADDIAEAAGLSRRTFWHYFATKEEAVAPLLVRSLSWVAEAFESRPAGEPLLEALGRAMISIAGENPDAHVVVGIVRMAREEPSVRRVWLQATSDMETRMTGVIAGRLDAGSEGMSVRGQAAMITGAIRIMAEEYAWPRGRPSWPR